MKMGARCSVTLAACLLFLGCSPGFDPDHGQRWVLVYRVAEDATPEELQNLPQLVPQLQRRLIGFPAPNVVRMHGDREVEIVFPGSLLPPQRKIAKQLIPLRGMLSFRIVANRLDHLPLISTACAAGATGNVVRDDQAKIIGFWVSIPAGRREEVTFSDDTTRTSPAGETELLLAADDFNLTNADVAMAQPMRDATGGGAVDFTLTDEAAVRMAVFTGSNLPDPASGLCRRLAIVLDNQVLAAPSLVGQISQQGMITGRFSDAEVNFLTRVLRAGALPVPLNATPVREENVPE